MINTKLKLFVILILFYLTDIFYQEDLSCIANLYLYIVLYGFICLIFLHIFDPRIKVDYNTNFTREKMVEIIITFIFILYILKVFFIIMIEFLKMTTC